MIHQSTDNYSLITIIKSRRKRLPSAGNGAAAGGDNLPVGTILPYQGAIKDIPEKWALCNGSNGTPNLTDGRFLEGSSSAKSWHSAGLPNIKASIKITSANINPTGSFFQNTSSNNYGLTYATNMGGNLYFDASKSSSIYGNSSTVQPKSYTVLYIMKIKA